MRILSDWDNVLLNSWQKWAPSGLLPFYGPIALFSAQIQWKTVPLQKHFVLWALSLKSETGRERFAPTDAAERSDPRVALPRSSAFCDIFKKRFVPVFGSVLELILILLGYQVSRTQAGMGEVRLLPVVSISHSQIDRGRLDQPPTHSQRGLAQDVTTLLPPPPRNFPGADNP